MAKKKKINQSQYGGKILGRVDEKGNKIAFIQNPTDEEDIAPVKQTNNTWFKKGTLDDSGYAIENPIDAINRINAGILMTGVDALGQFGRGFLGSAEGVTDIAKTTTADVLDFFGADNKARKLRESAERTWGVNEQLDQALASDNGTGIDDMSFLGEKGKTVPQGLGTTMFSMTTGGLGGALLGTTAGASATSMALLGMSAAGNSEQEAIKEMKANQKINGLSDKEIYKNAKLYGVLSGIIETGTEMMFGAAAKGSKLLGIGTGAFDEADDAVINALTKKISNKMIKTFTQAGLKATSEGIEEVASGFFNAWAKKITYMKQEDIKKLIEDENLLDSFLSGTFSAALSQAPGVAKHITTVDENGKLRLKSNNEIKDYITDLSTNEQKIADKVAESRFTEEMTNKEKSKIRKEVMDQLRNLELTSDEINKSLGDEVIQGEPADTLLHQIIQNENTKFNFDEAELQVDNKRVNKNATNVEAKIQQLANDFTNELNDIRNTTSAHKLFNEMKNVIQATGEQVRLTSYNELEKQGAVKLLTDEKGNPIRNKNGRLQYTDEKGNLIGINGFRSKDGIVLNSDSTRLFEATMGHEIGESIKANSQNDYKVLREIATELGKLDGTLTDETMKAIERTYGTLGERTDSYLDEYVNDKLGELFTKDSDLINRIGQKPTILRKIIDEVKYLVKRFTTKSAEGKKLLELQHNLENKLQESIRELNVNNKTQQGTQYSVSEEDLEKYVYPDQVYEAYKNEDKTKINQTIEELEEYRKTLDTDTDEGWSENFNTNAKIKALENGYESVYDYYVGEEKKRLRQEVEGEYGRGYRVLQEGIQNEKKNNQLQQDIAESTDFKNAQFQVIQNSNPMFDDYHVGIRSPKDIKTFSQAIEDEESFAWGDYTKEDAERDLARDRVTIYSSYPIKQGVFVSTSKIQAEQYAGGEGNQVYSKTVRPEKVAWISGDEGQYASVRNKFTEDIKYSLSVQEANTGTDNQGRQLSEGQMVRFGNSKTTDDDGNLVTVYHTTTNEVAQFNEFNPVGTPYYRFGDQVVNYFSDSKDMSGSYASQDYKMADTKKLNNVEEAQDYLNQISEETGNLYTLYQDEKGKWNLSQDKRLSREARDFLNSLSEEERQEMKDKIFTDNEMMEYDPDYAKVFSWNEFNKDLQSKYKSVTDKYTGSTDVVELQKEMINYLENPSWLKFENKESGTGIGYYDTEEQMLKNIKHDIQDTNMSKKSKLQYEGYVNITNPYIVDAEKRNWNQVIQQSNEFIDELDERVPEDVKNNLTRLYNESANKSNDARDNYEKYQRIMNDISNEYLTPNIDEDLRKMNHVIRRMGIDDVIKLTDLADPQLGVSGWYSLADVLKQEGVIGDATSSFIVNEFKIPENVKYWLDRNLHAELEYKDVLNLRELYTKNQEAYKEFEKYRMPNYYFMEQIQAEGNDYLGADLEDMLETRAETMGADVVGEEIAQAASVGFSKPELIRLWGTSKTTNDVVKEVIASNKDGTTNYDGVIFKNVVDYGGKSGTEVQANDVYVTFNSNQFKAVDNLNPTDDADIRYQLGNNEVAPIGNGIRSEQIKPQDIQEAIAPLQEQVQELTKTIQNIVPSRALTEEEANEYATQTQEAFENEPAPIRNNLTEEENQRMNMLELLERNNMLNEEQRDEMTQLESKINPVYEDEEISPVDTLNDVRDIEEVGSPKVKAYQYEHPEVKPFFQEEARRMLSDLDNTQPAQRYAWESQERGQGTSWEFTGTKRLTSPEIAELKDSKWNYTYDDIRKGLNAIIEDHGAENIAVAKRIEFYLDERLRNGYDAWGVFDENGEQYHVEPNQDYLNMLAEQEWQNYFDDINSQYPLEQLQEPQYAIEDEETDFSDVSIDNDIQNMTADDINLEPFLQGLVKSSENQAERQQLRNELNEKREVKISKQSNTRKAWNKFKSLFVNEFAVIDDYAKQTGNKDIKFKADAYNNYQAIAQANIETAQTDINGKRIGRSGNSIFEEAKSLGLEDTFDEYLKQWANVDRAKQGKGAANYSAKESYKIVKEMEAKHPALKRLGKDMWQYYRNARHNLRDAGIISQEVSDMLGRMYPHYTPYISENIENYFTDKGELKPKATIKRAKGGAAIGSLLSAEEAMQRYTKSEFNTILGNDLYREIVNTSNDIVQLGGDDRGMQFVNADNLYADKNGYYLTAYEDGNPITARISEEMYETLTRETKNRVNDLANTFSIVTKPLAWLSNVRRNILTSWSPTFIAKNFIKDAQEAVINSKYTKDMVANYSNPQTWIELIKGEGESDIFKNNYGSGLTMGQFDIDLDNYNPNAKNFNFLKGIKNANELIELAPRYAEFKASRQNGCSIQEAMYNAREVTTNFSRGGVITKAFNKYGMTFLNSSVQGFDKFIRNFSGENGAKGIVNSLAKAAIFGIAPAVFNELAFGSGDDKDEEYEALPDYIKDNYYIIKVGNGNFIRIPKGRVLSVFGSAARRTIEAMEGEENAFEGYWNNVQQQIGINNPEENNIFAPLIQAMGGRKLDSGQTAGSAWYGGDIIPSRLQKERPEDQYDASIDKLSIWLGQHTGISPYKINYVLDQYTGGMGDIFLPTITPEANSDGSIIAPIKDQFTADTITDNKYVSEFYDTKGKLYTGSKATDEDILKNKYMNSISSEMAKLYAERREVQADENLTKQQKYAKSQAIKAEINRLAKEGMDNYNNIITSNNYAKIGDTEYYKNANGQWTKTTDDVASLGLDTEEKSEYYKVKNDIYTTKKENDGNDKPLVVQDIVNSNLTPDAKVNLYTSNYKDDLIQPLVDSGMDVDSYLTFKSQSFTADKDSNGKSISGSKKQKVFDYINSMDVPYEQKLILAKSEYNSFNDNNYEIIEYIENTGMDYDERIELYKALGFKVDGDSISW